MRLKEKRDDPLQTGASATRSQLEATSENRTPSHEEIRCRAYEIYLERNDGFGDELDDWLRAERELQKVVLFNQEMKTPGIETDARNNLAKTGRSQ
jgi:hypothetical protein